MGGPLYGVGGFSGGFQEYILLHVSLSTHKSTILNCSDVTPMKEGCGWVTSPIVAFVENDPLTMGHPVIGRPVVDEFVLTVG